MCEGRERLVVREEMIAAGCQALVCFGLFGVEDAEALLRVVCAEMSKIASRDRFVSDET